MQNQERSERGREIESERDQWQKEQCDIPCLSKHLYAMWSRFNLSADVPCRYVTYLMLVMHCLWYLRKHALNERASVPYTAIVDRERTKKRRYEWQAKRKSSSTGNNQTRWSTLISIWMKTSFRSHSYRINKREQERFNQLFNTTIIIVTQRTQTKSPFHKPIELFNLKKPISPLCSFYSHFGFDSGMFRSKAHIACARWWLVVAQQYRECHKIHKSGPFPKQCKMPIFFSQCNSSCSA